MTDTGNEIMTVDEVAGLFNVHPRTVHRWIERGLPCLRPSEGVLRIERAVVMRWARDKSAA